MIRKLSKTHFWLLLFLFVISEGTCQRAAVLCDHHSGAERFVSAGSHLGEDACMGKWPSLGKFIFGFYM